MDLESGLPDSKFRDQAIEKTYLLGARNQNSKRKTKLELKWIYYYKRSKKKT